MRCPICNKNDTKVMDSRLVTSENVIRRRRKCESCQKRFTTHEKINIQMPAIVKSDGRRENYQRNKIIQGIKMACQKRPVAIETIESLTTNIEKQIIENFAKEISTTEIGVFVMDQLYDIDKVAYIRFASIYWNYKNIDDFINNLKKSPSIMQASGIKSKSNIISKAIQ